MFGVLIPGLINLLVFFLVRLSFAECCVHCLGYSINQVCLPGRSVRLFVIVFFRGQRNPLTAAMSSAICDKSSVDMIMRYILAIYFFNAIDSLLFFTVVIILT